jgi:4-diphosphocytidyl-2-C-methyl-D-erythritol kinase
MLFRQDGPRLVVQTPAKLNLFLEILGKRADGYHELETLMLSVGLYDTLIVSDVTSTDGTQAEEHAHAVRLRVFEANPVQAGSPKGHDPIPTGPENLVVRAAELIRKAAGVDRGVEMTLIKRIPAAAGLAGGSSDAAATLAALNRLWDLKLDRAALIELASQLGSDVGFFLAETPAAVCRGRGEQIESIALPLELHFVIARPWTGLSTALVYRHCRTSDRPRSVQPLVESLRAGHLRRAVRHLHNALQEPAERLSTEVTQLTSKFSQESVLGHMMSGSGTACFAVCTHRRQAHAVAARLRAQRVGRVFVAQSRP